MQPVAGEVDLERVGARVEQLLDEVAAADPTAARAATELVEELLALYGAGLARILAAVDDAEPGLAARLADDPLLGGLLVLHDLHPVDVGTRIEAALDAVRPYLGSHGGDVELVAVEGDVVRLRLVGTCNGCHASATTLETAVETALRDAAPEIDRLEVEGAVEQRPDGLIPLDALTIRRSDDDGQDWFHLDVSDLPAGRLDGRDVAGRRVLLGRVGPDLYAYHERCPACTGSLEGAAVDDGTTACPTCGSRYDLRIAGRPVGADGPALAPVPLVADETGVRVAPGGGAP